MFEMKNVGMSYLEDVTEEVHTRPLFLVQSKSGNLAPLLQVCFLEPELTDKLINGLQDN